MDKKSENGYNQEKKTHVKFVLKSEKQKSKIQKSDLTQER